MAVFQRPAPPGRAGVLFRAAALLLLAAALLLPAVVLAADLQHDLDDALQKFEALRKDQRKAAFRHNWQAIETRFQKIFDGDPGGRTAAWALFYLGRTAEESGRVSGLREDYAKAAEHYGRMASKFSKDGLADDALLRRARLNLTVLGDRDQAYADLLLIEHQHPKSNSADKARELLKELDRSRKSADAKVADKTGAKPPASSPASPPDAQDKPESAKPDAKDRGSKDERRTGKTAELVNLRYQSSDEYSRVVLELDRDVPYVHQRAKAENGRQRLTLDLQRTEPGSRIRPSMKVSQGLLKNVSVAGQGGSVRLVFEFQDLDDLKVFSLDNPFRIVIDGHTSGGAKKSGSSSIVAGAATPDKAARKAPEPAATEPVAPAPPAPEERSDRKGRGENTTAYKPPASSKKLAKNLIEQLGLSVRRIMVDPGHGGKDPGASAFGLMEKDLNLRMAKFLAAELRARGFDVVMTRSKDVFIPLEERTAMANVQKADMFISIHCNAHSDKTISGIETYSLNLAKTEDAVRVAARENAVSNKQISDLQFILTDLMLNSKMKESGDLANHVQSRAVSTLKKRWQPRNHGIKEAPFYVLMGAKMPAVLAEIGYVTNKEEAALLASDSYLKELARGMADGVDAYKHQIERFASL